MGIDALHQLAFYIYRSNTLSFLFLLNFSAYFLNGFRTCISDLCFYFNGLYAEYGATQACSIYMPF